ncbi:response regulator transcription factor (plasmid) [Deinococcus sp. KNUC1210]|uniref:response regulator transcription factor n=1 Tax=Deinococcus sp. KNUC1210 TaxID=2917691 RepID=UPI001EF00805|nr:response regulator transcription factor [Deinococcus sp. KNUC1210]ULH17117.1 response regulator transcription factor [Deinococcus sp. KNUC1210]
MLPLRVRIELRPPVLAAGVAAMLADESALRVVDDAADVLILDAAGLSEWLAVPVAEAEAGLVVLDDGAPWISELLERALGWSWLKWDAARGELLAAVQAAGAGLVSLPAAQARAVWQGAEEPELPLPGESVALTPREQEVLALLGLGLSNKRIARNLGVSDHTVKFHVTALYSKLNVSSRTAAVTRALQLGLLSV